MDKKQVTNIEVKEIIGIVFSDIYAEMELYPIRTFLMN